MLFDHAMDNWDIPAFDIVDDDIAYVDCFFAVIQDEEVASMEGRFHTA
jgi:hypothetical protein